MKVLIVSSLYYPEVGAAPSRLTNLARGLKEHGVDVDVLTCMPSYPKGKIAEGYRGKFSMTEHEEGITIYRYWGYASVSSKPLPRVWSMISFGFMIWFFALKRRLIKEYDHVIIQSPPILVGYSAVTLFRLYRKHIILNISDIWPSTAVETGAMREGGIFHRLLCRVEKYMYRKADAVMGQSQEIIEHVSMFKSGKRKFLYRNLQKDVPVDLTNLTSINTGRRLRIVYAGLLGFAQDILGLIKSIDFKELDLEFHIYGGGNQQQQVKEYAEVENKNVFYHGILPKEEMGRELCKYDASIVPLTTAIKGAVPSKIFDLMSLGIPVMFCGGGEGAEIIKKYSTGYVSNPGDYAALKENLAALKQLSEDQYNALTGNCIKCSNGEFNFDIQIKRFISFLYEKES